MSEPTITAQTDPANPINLSGAGYAVLMFEAHAAAGRTMGTLTLGMEWEDVDGNDVEESPSASTSGSPAIAGGMYIFEDAEAYPPGQYEVTVTAWDEQGGRVSATFVYTVVG